MNSRRYFYPGLLTGWVMLCSCWAGADALEWGDKDDGQFGGGGAIKFDASSGRMGEGPENGDGGALKWGEDDEDQNENLPVSSTPQAVSGQATYAPIAPTAESAPAGAPVGVPMTIRPLSPSGAEIAKPVDSVPVYAGAAIPPADADAVDRQKTLLTEKGTGSPDAPDPFEPPRREAFQGNEDPWDMPGLTEVKSGA